MSGDTSIDPVSICKEMGCSYQEFFASLATLSRELPCRVSDSGAILEYDSGEVRISLGPEGERKLGSMVLPWTTVSLEFRDLSEEQRTDQAVHQRVRDDRRRVLCQPGPEKHRLRSLPNDWRDLHNAGGGRR